MKWKQSVFVIDHIRFMVKQRKKLNSEQYSLKQSTTIYRIKTIIKSHVYQYARVIKTVENCCNQKHPPSILQQSLNLLA